MKTAKKGSVVDMDQRLVNLEHRFDLHEVQCAEKLGRIYDILKRVEGGIVYRSEFAPVKSLVYGAVSLMLVAVFSAVIGLVIIKG